MQSLNLFWFFFIAKILWDFLFKVKARDMRSDDEEDEDEVVKRDIQSADEKKGIEEVKTNSIKAANGHAVIDHTSYADAVVEGKKQR